MFQHTVICRPHIVAFSRLTLTSPTYLPERKNWNIQPANKKSLDLRSGKYPNYNALNRILVAHHLIQ